MKIKTSELEGRALDWAVAKCEGEAVRWSAPHGMLLLEGVAWAPYTPSRDGAIVMQIIKREGITVSPDTGID
jgi:hypothetical protein